jgi:hypothetical protein
MRASLSMPERMPRWLRSLPIAATLSLPLIATAGRSARVSSAADPATCGWSFLTPHDVPPTLQVLRGRAQDVPDWLPEAEALLLRWYRQCDATAGREAVHLLQTTRNRTNSSDPLLLAWLGVALVRGPEVQVPGATGAVLRPVHRYSNSERDGARLLARVAESNDWPEVAEELAAVAVATRRDVTLEIAGDALTKIAEERDDPAIWSALAEVELARSDESAAERASARAVSANAPRGLRVAGILRMQAGNDVEGAPLYLRGLANAFEDPDVEPYFDDLRLLLGADEWAQWQEIRFGRAEWIRQKWEWRARMAGVRLDERLGVNERRFVEVLKRYARQSYLGAAGFDSAGVTDTIRRPVDDRGLVYLRHGAPITVVDDPVTSTSFRGDRVAWVYAGPNTKRMVLEFARSRSSPDFYLSGPAPCFPQAQPVRADPSRRRPPGLPSPYATSLATVDPNLGWYYIRCQWNPETGIFGYADARETSKNMAETARSTESGIIRFDRPLGTAWNLYAFQTAAGPELVSFLSIETAGLEPAAVPTTRVDLGVLLAIGDPVTETVTQIDTTLSYASATPIPDNASLQWALPVRTPASADARVVLTVRNRADETQGRVASTTWTIPAFQGDLLLSDVVVAEPRAGVLRRGSHEIAPAPGHAILRDTPFRLYYELYGAQAGDPLSVSIKVLPAKSESLLGKLRDLIASREALSVEFEEPAMPDTDGVLRVERDYQAELEPGAYSVVLTVRDARTGETVTADTNLVIAQR